MCCLESEEVRNRITTDWKAAQVHVLPMMHLTFKVGAADSSSIKTRPISRRHFFLRNKSISLIEVKQQENPSRQSHSLHVL